MPGRIISFKTLYVNRDYNSICVERAQFWKPSLFSYHWDPTGNDIAAMNTAASKLNTW